MTNMFENPNSPMLRGEPKTKDEATLLDKKQELMELQEQINGALKEVEDAKEKMKEAENFLAELRKKDNELSEEIAKLEKQNGGKLIQETGDPLSDHPSEPVRRMGKDLY